MDNKEGKELENLALQKVLEVSSAIDAAKQILSVKCATDAERDSFKNNFYHGPAFPTMARLLLFEVALNWLAQFAKSVRSQIYDSFFLEGPLIEVLEALVPTLSQKGNDKDPVLDKICSSAERLLVLCFLEKEGIRRMVIEFDHVKIQKGVTVKKEDKDFVSRVAQLLASIPDKTRPKATSKLSSLYPFVLCSIYFLVYLLIKEKISRPVVAHVVG